MFHSNRPYWPLVAEPGAVNTTCVPDVGGGTRALPDQVRLDLALAEEHRFGSGTVYLCYRPA